MIRVHGVIGGPRKKNIISPKTRAQKFLITKIVY